MNNVAYLINTIEEYGKLVAYCIDHDISVWRSYWDQRGAGRICYSIDRKDKRLMLSDRLFYEKNGYEVVTPVFDVTEYGKITIVGR